MGPGVDEKLQRKKANTATGLSYYIQDFDCLKLNFLRIHYLRLQLCSLFYYIY
jgi:hypothetical protein